MPSRAADARAPSIRRTLWAYLGVLSALGALMLFFAARAYAERAANRAYDHLLVASSLSILDSVALVDGEWQVDLPYASLELLAMAPEDRVFYRVSDARGRTITGYPGLPPPRARDRGEPRLFDARYSGERVRFAVVTRRLSSASAQADVRVQVGQTRRAREVLANDMVLRTLAAILALSVLSLALVGWGVHRALRPLARIEHDLVQREPSNLDPLRVDAPLEMKQLVLALNRFMARLAANHDMLRGFMAEAAHQIRTPLAAIRAQAQTALDDPDDVGRQRSLVAIERNAGHMSRLVNQLLSDASVSHRASLHQFAPVELSQVVSQALEDVLPAHAPRQRARLIVVTDVAWVRGDALLLREAFKNVLDNAMKFGGGRLMLVALAVRDGECVLTVADRGPGLAAHDATRVFDRFACGADAPAGSVGLGLAIVRRVLDSHGGRIELMNRRGGGLAAIVHLPQLVVA